MKRSHVILSLFFCLSTVGIHLAHATSLESTHVNTELRKSSPSFMSLSIFPGEMLLGYLSGSAEFAISNKVTIGPYFSWSTAQASFSNSYEYQTLSLGGISTISLGHPNFTSGWFIQPFAYSTNRSYSDKFLFNSWAVGSNLGYAWYWDNGMNLLVGGGMKYTKFLASTTHSSSSRHGASSVSTTRSASISGLVPTLTIQLGYTF